MIPGSEALAAGPAKIVAVDWSGAHPDDRKRQQGIWMAVWTCGDGGITLADSLSRDELTSWLLVEAKLNASLVVGLDFSFGFPYWFARRLGATAQQVWSKAEAEGECWLRDAAYPFWRTGRPAYPADQPERRITEQAVSGRQPNSTFKLVGDGQVGAGSVRGMRCLRRLSASGFAVWPFTGATLPLALEIYPTACYPRGARATHASRARHLSTAAFAGLSAAQREAAAGSGDAFDAVCALLAMVAHRSCFSQMQPAASVQVQLEGMIWRPDTCVCREPVH